MSIARIQFLEKTDLGWHIRFTGILDTGFYAILGLFKDEQRISAKINCHWNPQLFNKKGGWFCTERILEKYSSYFENYDRMRSQAETTWNMDHQEDLWGETKSEREAKEARQRQEDIKRGKERAEEERKRNERERQWKQWEREQQQEYTRPPARPTSTGLTLTEALLELGFSAGQQNLTEIEVKKAFRQLAMVKHPDHGGSHEAMIKLNKAYQLVLWHAVQGVKV